jgi:hypothetical protein
MYNTIITREGESAFLTENDGKPRNYPTLSDALVSAQYLGLTKGEVELHFVKEGAVIPGALANTSTGSTGSKLEGDPLAGMTKKQLLAYAEENGITVDEKAKPDEIRAQIHEAQRADSESDESTGGTGDGEAGK